jgi:hypothetical protein
VDRSLPQPPAPIATTVKKVRTDTRIDIVLLLRPLRVR